VLWQQRWLVVAAACCCELLPGLLRTHEHLLLTVLLGWLFGLKWSDCVIAAGAGHEIGKHRLLSNGGALPLGRGEDAATQRMIVPQAKKSGERGGKRRFRDQKSKQKYLH
jgi:hypothetical protein